MAQARDGGEERKENSKVETKKDVEDMTCRMQDVPLLDLSGLKGEIEIVSHFAPAKKTKLPPEILFQECTCRDFPMIVRDEFRRKILVEIESKFGRDEKITLTSFASGRLGWEFKLLKELHKMGYTNVSLNVIDIAYGGRSRENHLPLVKNFNKHVEHWNSQGANFEVNSFPSMSDYLLEVEGELVAKSDLFVDIDSGGHLENDKVLSALNKKGSLYSLTSDWIYEGEMIGQGNFLTTMDDSGKMEQKLFFTRVKPKKL